MNEITFKAKARLDGASAVFTIPAVYIPNEIKIGEQYWVTISLTQKTEEDKNDMEC